MSLSGSAEVTLKFRQSAMPFSELAAVNDSLLLRTLDPFTWGDGAGQVNIFWHDQRTLAPQTEETLSLWGYSLIDNASGRGIQFTKVRLVYIRVVDYPLSGRATDDFGISEATTFPWAGPFGGVPGSPGFRLVYPSYLLVMRDDVSAWVVDSAFYRFTLRNDRLVGQTNIVYKIVIIGVGTLN